MELKTENSPTFKKFNGIKVGVLAIQGSFREHITALRKCGAEAVEIRQPEDLVGLTGLIIPGGESTTMANVAQRNGLIPMLKEFENSKKPIWGTCAGLIFLAERALGQKMGGQALLGGLDCTVHRNFFGSQINSFVADLPAPVELTCNGGAKTFPAVFIRAPAIIETGAEVEVLADYKIVKKNTSSDNSAPNVDKVIVAVKQRHLLATAFHPELTSDLRWHLLFLEMVANHAKHVDEIHNEPKSKVGSAKPELARPANDPGDLPVFLP